MTAKAPVIVVDLRTGMLDGRVAPPLFDADELVTRVRRTWPGERSTGRPVAFMQQNSPTPDQLSPGQPDFPIWPALGQAADEPTFAKTVENAFSSAALRDWVSRLATDEVIIMGTATNHCVKSMVAGAMERGPRAPWCPTSRARGRPGSARDRGGWDRRELRGWRR